MIRTMGMAGLLVLAAARLALAAGDPVGDLYGEEGSAGFVEPKAWQEQTFHLPPYPDLESRELIEVDLALNHFPFSLFIDPASLAIGEDGVVRYTAILRSRSGAANVFYEGIRCSRGQYRRYAYGGADGFRMAGNSRWRYIRGSGAEPYLQVLLDHFLCPSPGPGRERVLLRRLRQPNPDNFMYGEEE